MAAAALVAAVGVGLGAFGAHGLEERLAETGGRANWETGVRYHVWHALALLAYGLAAEGRRRDALPPLPRFVSWCFLIGILFFSGSLYLLALDLGRGVVWPFTPLGGTLFLVGWVAWAVALLRSPA